MVSCGRGVLYIGNALTELRKIPDESVDCVITSPPYYLLRDYGGEKAEAVWGGDSECEHEWGDEKHLFVTTRVSDKTGLRGGNEKFKSIPPISSKGGTCLKCGAWKGQLGHEPDPDMFVSHLADIFDEVYRVLKKTGNLFIVIGDTYAGSGGTTGGYKQSWEKDAQHRLSNRLSQRIVGSSRWIKRKQLLLIPYRLAIELQMRGWILRDMIIWAKKVAVVEKDGKVEEQFGNGLPESCKDRLTKSYEIIIHAVKGEKYYFNKPTTKLKPQSIERMMRGVSENHKYAQNPMYGGGEGLNRPRPNMKKEYSGKFKEGIDPESIGSMRARVLRNGASIIPEIKGYSYVGNVLQINTEPFPDAHFAVFPVKLVKLLMEMGCPQRVCSLCGAPYIVEEEVVAKDKSIRKLYGTDSNGEYKGKGKEGDTNPSDLKRRLLNSIEKIKIKKEKPFCNCNAPSIPATVLDPFIGSGTVALVAEETNRKWIGIEINPEYVKLIEKRLRDVQKKLFT